MDLNSFCVIVTDKLGKVLFWNRPTDLDSARKLYDEKCSEFNNSEKKTYLNSNGRGEMYSGMIFELYDFYTNKGLERKIKEWGGDLTIVTGMVTNIEYKFSNSLTGITIQLLHSTKT